MISKLSEVMKDILNHDTRSIIFSYMDSKCQSCRKYHLGNNENCYSLYPLKRLNMREYQFLPLSNSLVIIINGFHISTFQVRMSETIIQNKCKKCGIIYSLPNYEPSLCLDCSNSCFICGSKYYITDGMAVCSYCDVALWYINCTYGGNMEIYIKRLIRFVNRKISAVKTNSK